MTTPPPRSDADVVVEALDGNKFDLDEYSATAGDVAIAYLGNELDQPHSARGRR